MKIRKMLPKDKGSIMEILKTTEMFTDAEVAVAEELIDIFLKNEFQKDYIIYISEEDDGCLTGYVCYGPTPAAEGTFDLYWIAVSPKHQNKGIGKKLLKFTEDKVRAAGGRMIIIETSSREKYTPTQEFYKRTGYGLDARIKDFYSPGDDRLIFVKRFYI